MLSGIYQMRFTHAAQKIKAAIDAGVLGELLHIDVVDKEYRGPSYYGMPIGKDGSHTWTTSKELAGGGCLTTQSIHMLDLMQWFMNGCGHVQTVYAKCRTAAHEGLEVEDIATGLFTWENGVTGTITCTTCVLPAFKHRVVIHGTKGTVSCNGHTDDLIFWDIQGDPEKVDNLKTGHFEIMDTPNPQEFPNVPRHKRNLEDFLRALESNGDVQPLITGEEALKTELIREAMYASSELKAPLMLNQRDIDITAGADGNVKWVVAVGDVGISAPAVGEPGTLDVKDCVIQNLLTQVQELKRQLALPVRHGAAAAAATK